jgi:ABC-type transporter Mla subunit MlaD
MNERKFGYIILGLALCVILSIIGYSIKIVFFPKETRTIVFSRITNLSIDDPVKIRGKNIGKIVSIKQGTQEKGDNIYVTFAVLEPFTVYSDYYIYSADKGLMGDRVIKILPGSNTDSIINSTDTLSGKWTPSVSDALGSAWKLQDKIISLKTGAGVLLSGTPEKAPFVTLFSKFISDVDSFCNSLQNTVEILKVKLPAKIDTLHSIVTSVKRISGKMSTAVPTHIHSIEEQAKAISDFINKFDKQSSSLSTIVEKIKSNELIKKDHISPLNDQINDIQDLLDEIKTGLVTFRAKIILD